VRVRSLGSNDAEDLRQEYEVERARAKQEGRKPRPRAWVEADYWRLRLGRNGRKGRMLGSPIPVEDRNDDDGDDSRGRDELAALPIDEIEVRQYATERRREAHERACLIAAGLPPVLRDALLRELLALSPRPIADRIRLWLDIYPARIATHREIAADIGVSREAVTRAITRLRKLRAQH